MRLVISEVKLVLGKVSQEKVERFADFLIKKCLGFVKWGFKRNSSPEL